MSEQFHGAPTAAEWAICRGTEMRIQNFNMQPVFNAQSFATGKRRFGPKVPRFHLLDVASTNRDMQSTKGWNWTNTLLTDGSSVEATQPSFSLAQGQCFAYYCRVSWKFVAGPCLRHFMQQQRLRNEPIIVALLFSRAEIILFQQIDSLTEVRHLLTWGKAENHGSVRGTMILFQTRDWNPFDNASKRVHNLMPSFMKGLQSTHLPCRPSQVLSGRPSIGKKHAWLIFLTCTGSLWLLQSEATVKPVGFQMELWESKLWQVTSFFASLHVQQCALQHRSKPEKGCCPPDGSCGMNHFQWPDLSAVPTSFFSGQLFDYSKKGDFFVWQLWPEPFAWLFWTTM